MRGLICAALTAVAVLAACAPKGAPDGAFRKAGTPIYSSAVLTTERLAGRWVQVADFAEPGAKPCAATGLAIMVASPDRLSVQADLCAGGLRRGYQGDAVVTGPGRFGLRGADPATIGAEWWVLWADDGYRTLVIGTPSGQFGMILNREAAIPADRMRAAREILDWNGYDLGRLRAVAAP
jgi:apolipoprotein D and lipocalin family protein